MIVTRNGIDVLFPMLVDVAVADWSRERKTPDTKKPLTPEECEKYEQLALQAEEYNNNCLLTKLPSEIFIDIQSLEDSIKFFMKLSCTCKSFNKLLTFETIGKLCKNYALVDKNETLKKIMEIINYPSYESKRLSTLILICAGADANTKCYNGGLLDSAVSYNDAQMVAVLFKYHADPNARDIFGPVFFCIKTVEMAQMFIDNGVDVHATKHSGPPNVLWKMLENEYPSELMALYLEKGVDATQPHSWDNSCLLHGLAKEYVAYPIDNFLKKADLLLDAISYMINITNRYGETPLDLVRERKYSISEASEKLIALFIKCGGRNAPLQLRKAGNERRNREFEKASRYSSIYGRMMHDI